MRTEFKVFGLIAGLLLAAAAVYFWWTGIVGPHPEFAGTLALGLSGVLSLLCAVYCWLVSRRIPPRPEDRPGAEIADGAGPVGFFAPNGFWQVGIALSVAAGAVGIAMSQWWLLGAGGIALLVTTAGLAFEFYAGASESR
ncbi:aa3-type cytochrome oxidase subunit IV [Dactylosporangium sp. CA-092794]|uniref:aa3-type cytochrome oxidase subunit IV n=1 Tax=Dactylosporangium sp. CA-092794 TaxID=3239929 RepID=UPI003D8B7D61